MTAAGSRTITIEPGSVRITGLDRALCARLESGAALGLADPTARIGALLHVSRAWQPGQHVLGDAPELLASMLTGLRAQGASFQRLLGKCIVTDGGVWERLRPALDARGLQVEVRTVASTMLVEFRRDARMRYRTV